MAPLRASYLLALIHLQEPYFKEILDVEKRKEPKKGSKYILEKHWIKLEDVSIIVYLFYLLVLL